MKCHVGLGITARVLKPVVILTATSQKQVTILAFSQVFELNRLTKKWEVKIQNNDFSFFY